MVANAATRPREDRPMRRLRLPVFVFVRLVADDGDVPRLREARKKTEFLISKSKGDADFRWKWRSCFGRADITDDRRHLLPMRREAQSGHEISRPAHPLPALRGDV
jgi:hypothetical protein